MPPVSYEFTYPDYLGILRARPYLKRRSASLWIRSLVLWVAGFTGVLIGIAELGNPFAVAGAALAIAVSLTAWLSWTQRRNSKCRAAANQRLTLTLDEEGVRWSRPGYEEAVNWWRIMRVVANADCIVMFVTPLYALTIPRRAAESEEAFAALTAFAVNRACSDPPPIDSHRMESWNP